MTMPLRRADGAHGPDGDHPSAGQPAEAGHPAAGQPAQGGSPAGKEREYGLYAIMAALAVLAGLDIAALAVLSHNVNGAVAVIGALSSPVVAMVSAYFGIKVGAKSGSASAAAAEKARVQAENAAKSLLGHMAPEEAKPVMRELGLSVAD